MALAYSDRRIERTSSLADSVYEQLRAAIVKGELRPNERLVEHDLAVWLNVSRTPLRESLFRLAHEGLVHNGRRGWFVRDLTVHDISEIHEVRAALEGMAAFLAAKRATDSQIAAIATFHSKNRPKSRALVDRKYLVEYNDGFHDAVLAASGSERLRDFARRNREFFFAYRVATLLTDRQMRGAVAGHDVVVKALKARDADAAEAAMRDHVLAARDLMTHVLF